jgi:hypothetical protein
MTLALLKPALYQAEGSPAVPGHPALLGGECRCGHVFFPWQAYGCERCGAAADALTPRVLSGRGRVESCATVHLHASPDRPVPFVIAAVRLDDGPLVRGLVAGTDPVRPGDIATTLLTEVPGAPGDDGRPHAALDLRFARGA